MGEQREILDLLHDVHRLFGHSGKNKIPPYLDVGKLSGISIAFSQAELDIMRTALADSNLLQAFAECQQIIEDLATHLTTRELLLDLSGVELSKQEFEELCSGVLWFSLAASLDKREGGMPVTPFDDKIPIPMGLNVRLTVEGSLVMRLYISLVYMREGVLNRVISQGARNGSQCCQQIRKLLKCDYVRRIRNALSHGTFSPCVAGLIFRDDKGSILATPSFLEWLSMWIMLINLQSVAACRKIS
jgi:hypothetical protein